MNQQSNLKDDESVLGQRFINAYNRVEHCFQDTLGLGRQADWRDMLDEYERSGRLPRLEKSFLKMAHSLRNALSHGVTKADGYPAVPKLQIVQKLEAFANRLTDSPPAVARFGKEVATVKIGHPLAKVLDLISRLRLSQFPVYEDTEFCGLLTENGITRWFAHHVLADSKIDFKKATVRDLLSEEEERHNFQFVSELETENSVKTLFANEQLLEAVLITKSGKPEDPLKGIVTRWDMLNLEARQAA